MLNPQNEISSFPLLQDNLGVAKGVIEKYQSRERELTSALNEASAKSERDSKAMETATDDVHELMTLLVQERRLTRRLQVN